MTQEQIKEYDEMRGAGKLYQTSAVFLQDMSRSIMEISKGKMPVDLNSNIITAVMLYALSAEVALKALIKREGKQIPRQHDLKSLFETLDLTTQTTIKDLLIARYPEFDDLLENNKKCFVDWRYFYEGGGKTADISFLREFSRMVNLECTVVNNP